MQGGVGRGQLGAWLGKGWEVGVGACRWLTRGP